MKKIRIALLIALISLALISMCACDDTNDGANNASGTYTIQYVDDAGTHTITVSTGELFSLDSVPSRNGYEFLGLFDADQGGTQYVHANGSAISAFTDNRNLVLYPQFKAKEYTLVLDYGEAAVTGSRQIKASYGQTISELPINLTVENKTFVGWYTQENKKGTQVADKYGLIPQNSILTEDVFDLSDSRGFVYLYAGFAGEMHTVTFYYGNDSTPEEMQIEHGTYVSEIVTSKRVDGKAAISWTKTNGSDEVYTGKVEGDMILWAYEYAPVIDFNSNGGNQINSIVAKSGSSITLPTPTRDNYKFAGWYTAGGSKYTATVMGSDSVSLTARWNPMILFNTNGGTAVDDISAEVGSRVTLPTTSKDGFMFAGWYTEQGQEYTATNMPQNSVKLVAKYWKVESKRYVAVSESKVLSKYNLTSPSMDYCSASIDISDLYDMNVRNINLHLHYDIRGSGTSTNPGYAYLNIYYKDVASDAYCIWKSEQKITDSKKYYTFSATKNIVLQSNKLYFCGYLSVVYTDVYLRNCWVEIEYPDMSKLY